MKKKRIALINYSLSLRRSSTRDDARRTTIKNPRCQETTPPPLLPPITLTGRGCSICTAMMPCWLSMTQVSDSRLHVAFTVLLSCVELYTQSAQHHSHSMQHHHVQYHPENPSLSPQQSSTSEADETCTPPPLPPPPTASSLNRGIVGAGGERSARCSLFRSRRSPSLRRS